MNAAQIEQFRNDGFLHLRNFFDTSETAMLDANFQRVLRDVVPTMPREHAMCEDYSQLDTLKQLSSLHRYDSYFANLLAYPKFVETARTLLDDEVVAQQVEAFIKPPRQGTPTPPHQDGYYFCLTPNEALTFWVPIGKIDATNGALCYRRGSHKHGVFGHDQSSVLGFSQGMSATDLDGLGDEVVCEVQSGDLLVHHSLTVHYAAGNQSDRPRRAVGLVFYAQSAERDEIAWARYMASVQEQQAVLIG